ncbi:MAG: hypothetical protein ACK5IM_08955 [Demequina sp.]|uniref:hypothetical protein n=1 Tax=Demequina sp. TaxID=2050685 RepID=UPI003A864932
MTATGIAPDWESAPWAPVRGVTDLSWQGVTHTVERTTLDGIDAVRKTPASSAAGIASAGAQARLAASAAGLGPRVLAHDAATGITIEEDLGPAWRVGTTLRLKDAAVLRRFGDARRAFRDSDADLAPRDLLAEAAALTAAIGDAMPEGGLTEAASHLDALASTLASGPEPVPCWLSSEVSDIQIGPSGIVLLTGGSHAGLADPFADIGTAIAAVSPYGVTDREAFEALAGPGPEGAWARAVLWSIVADLRSAGIALIAHAMDPARGHATYAVRRSWRLSYVLGTHDIGHLITAATKGWT